MDLLQYGPAGRDSTSLLKYVFSYSLSGKEIRLSIKQMKMEVGSVLLVMSFNYGEYGGI